jgi:hypothetical protein
MNLRKTKTVTNTITATIIAIGVKLVILTGTALPVRTLVVVDSEVVEVDVLPIDVVDVDVVVDEVVDEVVEGETYIVNKIMSPLSNRVVQYPSVSLTANSNCHKPV